MAKQEKDFLDYEGLSLYDEKIKEYINNQISQLKEDIDDLPTNDVDDILDLIGDDDE